MKAHFRLSWIFGLHGAVQCRIVGQVLDELSKEYIGKVNFYKVNTEEEEHELASMFGIRVSHRFCLFRLVENRKWQLVLSEKRVEKNY